MTSLVSPKRTAEPDAVPVVGTARTRSRTTYGSPPSTVHVSLGIGHFAFGGAGAIVLLLVTGLHRKTTQDGAVAVLSGLWAMLPDLGLVLPGVSRTDSTPLANLFWFHYTLDTNPFTDSTLGSAALAGLLVGAVVALVLVEGNDERT